MASGLLHRRLVLAHTYPLVVQNRLRTEAAGGLLDEQTTNQILGLVAHIVPLGLGESEVSCKVTSFFSQKIIK